MKRFFERLDELDFDPWDSEVIITRAAWAAQSLSLTFHVKAATCEGDEVQEDWRVDAEDVFEHRIELGQDCVLEESTTSPRLVVAQSPGVRLMFGSTPTDVEHFLHDLRTAHDEAAWDRFGKYGLGGDLQFGSGVFAEGPLLLMDAYQTVLNKHGMRPTQLWLQHPVAPPAVCLTLAGNVWKDDRYVLATSLTTHRL